MSYIREIWAAAGSSQNDCFRGVQLDKGGVNSCNDGV
jgi:hypothetical protein